MQRTGETASSPLPSLSHFGPTEAVVTTLHRLRGWQLGEVVGWGEEGWEAGLWLWGPCSCWRGPWEPLSAKE